MSRSIFQAIRELLLSYPDTVESVSHGAPVFKASGKTFAYLTRNHHNDGRLAIWVASPPGVQQDMVALDAGNYFVPPYLGVKGWLGVDLGKSLPWPEISARVFEAWQHIAPSNLKAEVTKAVSVAPADTAVTPEDINPLLGAHPRQVLSELAAHCARLPETAPREGSEAATWLAGKKPFVRAYFVQERLRLMFWVGVEQQTFMTEDPRFSLPMYYHSNGWIELDVQDSISWEEVSGLLEISYRNFALKRMLKALDAQ